MVKPLQDVLCQVAYNCNQHTPDDIRTLENVVSAKLKTRLFSQPYILCVKLVDYYNVDLSVQCCFKYTICALFVKNVKNSL